MAPAIPAIAASLLAGCGAPGSLSDQAEPPTAAAEEALVASNARALVPLTAGVEHTCAIEAGGKVVCFGSNEYGQLGDGGYTSRPDVAPVLGVTDAVAVAAGAWHSCALIADGTVSCWGGNQYGESGDLESFGGTSPKPKLVAGISNAVAVSASGWQTCALLSTGVVACWGENGAGQLGTPGPDTATPRFLPAPSNGLRYTAIAAGGDHACAMRSDATVACWGANNALQLGVQGGPSTTPIAVPGLGPVTSIAADWERSCVTLMSGQVVCWGWYWGVGGTLPTVVLDSEDAVQVGIGWNIDIRRANGAVTSLVDGNPADAHPVDGIYDAVAMGVAGVGGQHQCVARADGSVACWGLSTLGQLGFPSGDVYVLAPTPVPKLTTAAALSLGLGRYHSCAKRPGEPAKCWGRNESGQLGDGTFTGRASMGGDLSPGFVPTAVAAGHAHSCLLGAKGQVSCAGNNTYGTLGVGSQGGSSASWLPVVGLDGSTPVVSVAAGAQHTCSLGVTGRVQCWGQNADGQLGIDSTKPTTTPSDVGLAGVTTLVAGDAHTCAVVQGGSVYCWGRNASGQLGSSVSPNSLVPAPVTGLPRAIALAAGSDSTCALTHTGAVYCWGANDVGQLGRSGASSPVPGVALTGAVAITAGARFACALTQSGTAMCWGANEIGQLGRNVTGGWTYTPGLVKSLGVVSAIDAGSYHACAITPANTIYCWGRGAEGQLGAGNTSSSPTPVLVTP